MHWRAKILLLFIAISALMTCSLKLCFANYSNIDSNYRVNYLSYYSFRMLFVSNITNVYAHSLLNVYFQYYRILYSMNFCALFSFIVHKNAIWKYTLKIILHHILYIYLWHNLWALFCKMVGVMGPIICFIMAYKLMDLLTMGSRYEYRELPCPRLQSTTPFVIHYKYIYKAVIYAYFFFENVGFCWLWMRLIFY